MFLFCSVLLHCCGAIPSALWWVKRFNTYLQDEMASYAQIEFSFRNREILYRHAGHSNTKDIANFIPGKGLLVQGNASTP